jgi:glycosyltransferase involved in cell wall biosynthesis
MLSDPDAAIAGDVPSLSVIVPVFNGAASLGACLQALSANTVSYECIVVDDGSTDDSAEIARSFGAQVLATGGRTGPAVARNLGANSARAPLLLFIDADVCVQPDTLGRVVAAFHADTTLSALFGSYDDSPARSDFLSQYRNLMHHFVHQHSRREARTFWSGFGAIRTAVFLEHGGFDTKFGRPSIEDIELGHRLYRSGCKIVLDRTLQVKHLKEWSFFGMLRTDVMDRALPWTELILRDSDMPNDLNVSIHQRISVALAFIIVGIALVATALNAKAFLAPLIALAFLLLGQYEVELTTEKRFKRSIATALLVGALAVASLWNGQPLVFVVSVLAFLLLVLRRHYYSPVFTNRRWVSALTGACLVGAIIFVAFQPGATILHVLFLSAAGSLILLNARFYVLLASKRGKFYALGAIPFHFLFFLYSGIAFMAGLVRHWVTHRHRNNDVACQERCRRAGTAG